MDLYILKSYSYDHVCTFAYIDYGSTVQPDNFVGTNFAVFVESMQRAIFAHVISGHAN